MARRTGPYGVTRDKRNQTFILRFRHGGRQYKLSTRTRDPGRAQIEAARLFAEVVSRQRSNGRELIPAPALDALFARWLVDIESEIDESTWSQYKMYARVHWLPFFAHLDQLSETGAEDYYRARLRRVRRTTVVKELSAMRRFLRWCRKRGFVAEVPEIPSPPRRATGVDYDGGKRKKVRVDLSPDEVEAVLAELPERTKRGHPARAFFTVMYETTLRRGTLTALRAPHDYARGGETLVVREEADKARYGRELPLSRRARQVLDAVVPDVGRIFEAIDYRHALKHAALRAGLSQHRARHLSNHDWRHAALTHLGCTTTNLAGMAYLAGHKQVTTTARYVHADQAAAASVLESRDGAAKSRG